MTEKSQSKRFKILAQITASRWVSAICVGSPFILGMSCATVPRTVPAPSVVVQSAPTSVMRVPVTEFQARVSPAKAIDGSVVLVRVEGPFTDDSSSPVSVTGQFDDISLPFYREGKRYFAVLGIPHSHVPGKTFVKVQVTQGNRVRSMDAPLEITPGSYAAEVLKVQKSKVQPTQPKVLRRIKAEQSKIGLIYHTITPQKYWHGPFILPIQSTFTSQYGSRRLYNGVQQSFHPGLDLKAVVGTAIRADAGGKVVMAEDLFFTGLTVMIDHGYGVITFFAHMSQIDVKVGQMLSAGEHVGLSGKTGRVTGPHLHWQAVIQRQKVNPWDLTKVLE